MTSETRLAIGLMSGTSLDGIDAVLLRTNGEAEIDQVGEFVTIPYSAEFREELRQCFHIAPEEENENSSEGSMWDSVPKTLRPKIQEVSTKLADYHADAVRMVLEMNHFLPSEVDVIGFHGHTVAHAPEKHYTLQIGDVARLHELTGITVVHDFRSNDVRHGGQGAPIVPIFHRAIALRDIQQHGKDTVVFVNIGGVANVTYIGDASSENSDILAFDVGPGVALLDDWINEHIPGKSYDEDGIYSRLGTVPENLINKWLRDPFFEEAPPKSLDRNKFTRFLQEAKSSGLSVYDIAAAFAEFTAAGIAVSGKHMPNTPRRWILCGGGRQNDTIIDKLERRLSVDNGGVKLQDIDEIGWDGDAVEACAMAYLAIRSLDRKPFTFPGTTGVHTPLSGGKSIASKQETS
eukprot:gb/GECG01008390.1/.p1 GENE.gb/GECG01008390.1/~~gb/GECG01008390.1/.p1  ORF type:complete len:405 (+),score=56.27 gb/GECG01008390.1/:1-1215(+)